MASKVIEDGIQQIISNLKEANISFENKRVLVTGGAGFLGSWICDVLVYDNAHVVCLDNLASGRTENIEHLKSYNNFEFINHDISKPIFFDKGFDTVMHLASRASPFEFEKYPIQILKANTMGVWVALGIAKKYNARFLFTSSSEIYGDPDPHFIPTPETYRGNVDPIGPRGCYDEAKRCGESFVISYHRQHGLDTRIARVFNTFGPLMRADDIYGRVVPRFIQQALTNNPITVFGNGSQTRAFTYVTDQVSGLLRLLMLPNLSEEVVNIGNDKETSVLELAQTIKRLTSSKSEITFHQLPKDDPKRRCPDVSKAKRLLGWKPTVSLEEGLVNTINWFKAN